MPDVQLVVVRTYLNVFDAEVARSALDAAGITALIRTDDCGGMRPHLQMRGVDLLVTAEDATEADSVLDEVARPVPATDSEASG